MRWTLHVAIRAEYTTVSRLWFQRNAAAFTLVEVNAGVGRHFFDLRKATFRTSNLRFENDHFNNGTKAFLRVANSLLTVIPVASSRSGLSVPLVLLP